MNSIRYLIKKEFLQFRRDRKMVGMSFVAPVLQLIVLGFAANLDVTDIPTAVLDQDNTAWTRTVLQSYTSSGYFRVVEHVEHPRDIQEILDEGRASVVLVFPKGFERNILSDRVGMIQLLADGTESNTGTIALNYAQLIANRISQAIIVDRISRTGARMLDLPMIDPEVRVWYNADLKSRRFMVPSVLALLLMVMTLILTSLAIVKEKELGTLEQLVVTPLRPYQLITGKLLPFVIIGLVDVGLVILVSTLVFSIPVKGGIGLLFLLSLVFLMTTLGLGLFVSTISRTQQQAMMSSIFFLMLPMIFFSGFVFPIENMPDIIQGITYFLPLRYFFVIIRGLFLKGVGLEVLWPQALALLGFGVVIFGLSIKRFHKRIS